MPLGDHGRRQLVPFTGFQNFLVFPFRRFYQKSVYFRAVCTMSALVTAGWAYVGMTGANVWFTPYDAVHHSISHKFAHDMEHLRYPARHEEGKH